MEHYYVVQTFKEQIYLKQVLDMMNYLLYARAPTLRMPTFNIHLWTMYTLRVLYLNMLIFKTHT